MLCPCLPSSSSTHTRTHPHPSPTSGIFGLGRKFRIMDDDGSKTVSFPEFTKALRETGVIIDESSARKLFQVRAPFGWVIVSREGAHTWPLNTLPHPHPPPSPTPTHTHTLCPVL
jgi:hypothetical protein